MIESIRQRKEDDAEKLLRTQFKMEMLVYTQDRTYSSSLKESKKEEEEEENQKKSITKFDLGFLYIRDNHATLAELMLHLKSYYKVRVDHSTTYFLLFSWRKTLTQLSFLCSRLQVNAWLTRSL